MNKKQKWISATLLNDEASSDKDMIAYFIKEGKMSRAEAEFYVKQRSRALLDDLGFKLQVFCSKSGSDAKKVGGVSGVY